MILVRIIIDFEDTTDFLSQTPRRAGVWQDLQFTLEPAEKCDFAIVCNRVGEKTSLIVPPDNVWQVTMEPPVANYHHYRRSFRQFRYVFTQDTTLRGARYVHSHGALPWWVGLSYDELIQQGIPEKTGTLSWITSNSNVFPGHAPRLRLLAAMRGGIDFALWGMGFRPLKRKWDGLAPFRYSLAIENYRGEHYWTEKIADCYLAWTMPIYWGATNIASYFPPESMALVDPRDPDTAVDQIKEIVCSDRFERNIDAIAYSRDLVLNKYQFFPFIADRIHRHTPISTDTSPRSLVVHPPTMPVLARLTSALQTTLARATKGLPGRPGD